MTTSTLVWVENVLYESYNLTQGVNYWGRSDI